MKINPSQGFQKYQSYLSAIKADETVTLKAVLEEHVSTKNTENTDKVMISEDAVLHAELSRAATAISSEVDGLGNAQRLAELKKSVEGGTYQVATAALAEAILGYQV